MFFRSGFKKACRFGLAVVLFALFISGCSLRIGESPAKNQEIQLGDQVGCLSNIGQVLSEFLQGQIEDRELGAFLDCAAFSIESFETYTVGENPSQYHPREIRHFLHQYFLKDKKISDGLLDQVMNVKILLLGGNKDSITREELNSFIGILKIWKKEFLALNRYMKVFNWGTSLSLKREFSPHVVDEALVTLKKFVRNLVGTFKGQSLSYNWNDLEKLMREFRAFTNWNEVHKQKMQPEEHWTLLVQTFRKVTFNASGPVIAVRDLSPFLEEMSSWLGLVLKFKYHLSGQWLSREPGLTHLDDWTRDLFRLIERALDRHPKVRVSYADIHQLFLALENFFQFPLGITADDIYSHFPKILNTLLRRTSISRDAIQMTTTGFRTHVDFKHFEKAHVKLALSVYSEWFEIQDHLSKQFPVGATSIRSSDEIWFNPNVTLFPYGASDTFEDLRHIIRNIPPLYRDDEDMTFLVEIRRAYSYRVSHDFHNLSKMNLYRTLMAVAVRGYARNYHKDHLLTSTMTADEVQVMYKDLKPLGVKLGFLDPRSDTAGYRSFNEANLFTYVSDGLGPRAKMSFEEGMLLLAYLWSGSSLSRETFDQLLERCALGPLDIRNERKVERSCVETELGPILRAHITTMPSLKDFLNRSDAAGLRTWALDLLTAAYSNHSVDEWVEKAEIDVVSMIVHYSESVMTKFNVNANQVLEGDEINAAIPLFSGFIKEMGKSLCITGMDQQRVEDVFRHIVVTGEIPKPGGWLNNLGLWNQFRSRRGAGWDPDPALDRGHITSVFASIIAKSLIQNQEPILCGDQ